MPDQNYFIVREMIRRHEGLNLKPYRCPKGYLTIGYGINLEEGIFPEEAEFMMWNRIIRAEKELKRVFEKWGTFSKNRQNALIDMTYNLGINRFLKFAKMILAIEAGEWTLAAVECLNSEYAKQVGPRATEVAKLLQEG